MPTRYANSGQDEQLIKTLTDRVHQGISNWYGSSSFLASRAPQIRCYTNSFLLRYVVTTSTGEKAILLKLRRHPKMTSLTGAVQTRELHKNIPDEYNTLQYVYEQIGDRHQHFTAIRPLAYFEDCFAIVMEEFPSRSLRHLLQTERNSNRSTVQVIAERAGELLRFFHERVYSTTQCPYSASDVLADAETHALHLQQHTRGHIQAQTLLDSLGGKLSGRDLHAIQYTSAHQDLSCDNVLFSTDGKVCLVDIKVKPAPIYSDLGLLLIHPETFRDQIFRDGRYFSQTYLRSYRDSILKGYFGELHADEFLVHVYAAIRVLDKWAMHEELFSKYKGWKHILTRPLSPRVTSYFQRLWNHHLQMIV